MQEMGRRGWKSTEEGKHRENGGKSALEHFCSEWMKKQIDALYSRNRPAGPTQIHHMCLQTVPCSPGDPMAKGWGRAGEWVREQEGEMEGRDGWRWGGERGRLHYETWYKEWKY